MQRKFLEEWQILRQGKSSDFMIIVGIAGLFLAIIMLNVRLIFQITSNQTEEIGQMQLESIRADFQDVLTKAEESTTQMALDAEQALQEDSSRQKLTELIFNRKRDQISLTGGAADRNWAIIPDFNMPDDYHAPERLWYKGAIENPDGVYISEPYVDAASGNMCFTMSTALPDHNTVVGLDFNFTEVQKSIIKMTSDSDRNALIVTKNGMIIGYSDMSLVGERISRKLPEYEPILERIVQSQNHDSFVTEIDGIDYTIFSSETDNGWYMILSVNEHALYKNSYTQMYGTMLISLIMLGVIIVFYLNSVKNRLQADAANHDKAAILSNLSPQLLDPVNEILKLSSIKNIESDINPVDNVKHVYETAEKLRGTIEQVLSFSAIKNAEQSNTLMATDKESDELARRSHRTRIGISAVLIIAMISSMGMCIDTTFNWGDTKMHREVDIYEHQLSNWIEKQRSILSMFTNIIAERPETMDDYESAVKLLNDIAKNYPEISVCYMANPYKEHQVIMNNGWEGPPGWRVDTRPWYIDTERAEDGFSISAPYYDDQTGLYCITLSQVVYGPNNEFLGIFGIDFYIDRLIKVLGESYSKNGYAFLVDRNGIIINHPNKTYEMSINRMTDINGTEYQRVYSSNGIVRTVDYNNMSVACLAEKDETSQFTVIVASNWWNIYGSIVPLGIAFAAALFVCVGAVIILIDKLLEKLTAFNEKLQENERKARAADEAKSKFLAHMSHEIRTPLNAVLGMNEMILRESPNNDISEYAANIQSAGRTLLTIINGILDFSKISDGKMTIVPVKYETQNLIDDLINMISGRAEKKGLDFITLIDPNLPKTLHGDDVRIKQVVTNILTNAVKYTDEGSVTLLLRAESVEGNKLKMHVEVKDTGIGLKQEDIPKLFNAFERIEEERNRTIEGTGLGMSITQRLLKMMKSELNVESEYGSGSTFSFTLEQEIIDPTAIGAYGERRPVKQQDSNELNYLKAPRARIMVVDDNAMNLKVMRGLLKANEIVPELAQSGMECLEMAARERYDIIFLDYMMPKLNGIETLQKLKALENNPNADTPVISLTASATNNERDKYLEAGFSDYLSNWSRCSKSICRLKS